MMKRLPVYDNGGDVSQNNYGRIMAIPLGHTDVPPAPQEQPIEGTIKGKDKPPIKPLDGEDQASPDIQTPQYMPGGDPNPAPDIQMPAYTGSGPALYDNGGDVHVGKQTKPLSLAEKNASEWTRPGGGYDQWKKDDPAREQALPPGGTVPEGYDPVHPQASVLPQSSLGKLPVYDDGGNVDVNDGNHQVAVLENGEKVLTPEQADQYRAEHPEGLTVDRGMRNMMQPAIGMAHDLNQEQVSSEPTPVTMDQKKGGSDATGLSKDETISKPENKTPLPSLKHYEEPEQNQETTVGTFADQMKKEPGQESTGKPVENGMEQPTGDMSGKSPKMDPNSPEGKIIHQDKVDAAKKGDLVGLGKAVLNEKHLAGPLGSVGGVSDPALGHPQPEPKYAPIAAPVPPTGITTPATAGGAPSEPTGTPAYGSTVPPQYGGPGKAVQPGESINSKQLPQDEHKFKLQEYDRKIQESLDKAAETNDPAYQEQADRLKIAKAQFEKNSPWGSAGNHPGVLGRIGHVAARIGNIAGDVFAPSAMELIPGTQLNKEYKAGVLGNALKEDTSSNLAQEEERYKEHALEVGKDPTQATFRWLQTPAGGSHSPEEALKLVDTTKGDAKEKEAFENDLLTKVNPKTGVPYTREDATREYYQMKAGTTGANVTLKPEEISSSQKTLEDRWHVLNPGKPLPTEFTLPNNATKPDYDRLDKAMEQIERATGTKAQQDTANALRNNAVGERADNQQHTRQEQAGKVYDEYSKQVDKGEDPFNQAAQKANGLIHELDANNKQSDALIAPALLSASVGGAGSGLRMNEAEISRILGGRSVWDSLRAHANQLVEKGGTFDATQRAQLREIASYLVERASAASSVYEATREKMLSVQGDEAAVRKAYADGKRIASAIERQGIVPEGKEVKQGDYVYYNGQVLVVGHDGKGHPAL